MVPAYGVWAASERAGGFEIELRNGFLVQVAGCNFRRLYMTAIPANFYR
jgi:hypothetical protein